MLSCKGTDSLSLSSFLPLQFNGWTAQGEDALYNPKTIFEYINRAGEVYSAFNFQWLLTRLYHREGQPDIHVDFFDMGSARNAYGIFTFNPEGQEVGVGQGSTFKGRLLVFWKDRYFVSLYSEAETEETRDVLLAMGRDVASSIEGEGQIPAIVSRLPKSHLIGRRKHFFFSPVVLNHFHFVSKENILQLGENTDAVLARYQEEDGTYTLLFVEYSDKKKALEVLENYRNVFMPSAFDRGPVQTAEGKWTGALSTGSLLVIVWDASSQSKAEELFRKINGI